MKNIKNHILNIIYPDSITCIGCGRDIDLTKRYGLCDVCISEVPWIKGRSCNACGGPLSEFYDSNICNSCAKFESVMVSCIACYGYSGLGKDLIMDLKYNRKTYLGVHLAEMMSDLINTTIIDDIDLITTVPLHKKRLLARGFNQMDLVGQPLSQLLEISYQNNAITRLRNTPRLKTLDRQDRKSTIDQLFEANRIFVVGKRVLLIDDIFTTGSTMNACAKALLDAGALTVYGAVLSVNFRD